MGPADVANPMTQLHQLPGKLRDVLLGLLGGGSSQVDSKAGSSWRLEFAPPSLMQQPLVPLSKATTVARVPDVNWSTMSGTWIKDKKASDSMEPVLQLMCMRGLVRQAIKLVKGMNIKHKDDLVTIEVFSVIGWFKVMERYSMTGEPSSCRRRDLRRGQHHGKIRLLAPPRIENPKRTLESLKAAFKPDQAEDEQQQQEEQHPPGSFTLDLSWGEPHSGSGWDVYELKAPDLMHVHSTVIVGDEAVKTTSVFFRKK